MVITIDIKVEFSGMTIINVVNSNESREIIEGATNSGMHKS